MNILHITSHLNAGGITSYLRTLTKGCVQKGHNVFIVSSGGNMEQVFLNDGVHIENRDIRTKSILSPKLCRSIKPLAQFIEDHQIQIIHAHTRTTQALAHKLQKKTAAIFVSTCHGYFRPHFFRRLMPFWGEAVVAISPQVMKHLEADFQVPSEHIALVESGIDLEDFPEVSEEIRHERKKELGLEHQFIFGTIARLSDVKGVDILIKSIPHVLKKHQNFRVLLVGQGKQEPELRALVKDLKLEDMIVFNETVSQTQQMLAAFDMFIVPSRSEGLGLSAIEALGSGLPVIAANVGGLKTLIEEGKTGLFVPSEDPKALAESILSLMKNEGLRQELAKNARQFIEQRFQAEVMVEKTLNLYARLMV